jgi:hypothetical protein
MGLVERVGFGRTMAETGQAGSHAGGGEVLQDTVVLVQPGVLTGLADLKIADRLQARVHGGARVLSVSMKPSRYRCRACGNLTRFDVTVTRRTRAFHHYTVGGDLTVEDEEVLHETVEDVSCRWCGTGRSVEELQETEA